VRNDLSMWKALVAVGAGVPLLSCAMDLEEGALEQGVDATRSPAFHAIAGDPPVGLSLWWRDGEVRTDADMPRTVTLYEDFPRYLHELDISVSIDTLTDEGITPVMEQGDLAGLDWSGVEHVETDWRPNLEGDGYIRQRFYRGAAWMDGYSLFLLFPVKTIGGHQVPVGAPIVAQAGFDDMPLPSDDGFVRRFVARQLTYGCADIDDCSDAVGHSAQAFVQFRNSPDPDRSATHIPEGADGLALLWTADPGKTRFVPVEHASYADTDWEYGFEVHADVVSEPANGQYFTPGESLDVQVTFTDGAGNRLHPEGSLPSYIDFATDAIPSGLRYYDGLKHLLTLYYVLKHREGLIMYSLSGPTDQLKQGSLSVDFFQFFAPQLTMATVEDDGYTGLAILNPSIPQTLEPTLPVSDTVTFTLPQDALPGSYVVTIKARRDWGGEALNRAGVTEIQVGTSVPTDFHPTTGNCENCHDGTTSLGNLLHGLDDRRTCYSCHSALDFEPDQALDYRIHYIHTRSSRVIGDPSDCSMCHLSPPQGAPRGFPGVGFDP
jgi:hypothetical protein